MNNMPEEFQNGALPTVHTNPSLKRSFSIKLFKSEEFEIDVWTENILKTELF